MAEIHLDRDKAQRLIATLLRDERKMQPGDASSLATAICTRLQASMPLPTKPGLRGYRMIRQVLPHGKEEAFRAELAKYLDADDRTLSAIWRMAYDCAVDLPEDVADPRNY